MATKSKCASRSKASNINLLISRLGHQCRASGPAFGFRGLLGAGATSERLVPRPVGDARGLVGFRSRTRARPQSVRHAKIDRRAAVRAAGITRTPRPQLGGNVRWGVTNNLTLNGTIRPDFAEVESDAGKFVIDPRQALFFPEKRPFFLDGLEQFNVPHNLIYTRRITQPEGATKLTGKVAGTSIGFLAASDDPSLSPNGRYQTVYNILRAQRDIGGQSRIGMAYTDRVLGGDYNRVADLDGRLLFGDVYSGSFQFAESFDKTRGLQTNAPLWEGILARNGKRFGFRYTMNGISDQFRASSGFISRAGIVHGALDHRATWFNERGSTLETLTGDILVDEIWQYSHFTRQGDGQDKKFHLSTSAGLRGGWTLGAGVYWETFGYDTQLYGNYRIERTVGTKVDTIPFVGVGRIPNRDYVTTLVDAAMVVVQRIRAVHWRPRRKLLRVGASEHSLCVARVDGSPDRSAPPHRQLRLPGLLAAHRQQSRRAQRDSPSQDRISVHAFDVPPRGRRIRSRRARRFARRDANVPAVDHRRQEGARDAQPLRCTAITCSHISRIPAPCFSWATAIAPTRRPIRPTGSPISRSSARPTTSS